MEERAFKKSSQLLQSRCRRQLLEGSRQNCTSKELCMSRVVDKKSVVDFRALKAIKLWSAEW
jgi:hypothetical protein